MFKKLIIIKMLFIFMFIFFISGNVFAASTTTLSGLCYPNANYIYYNNEVTSTPATIISTDTYSGSVTAYLKSITISNSSTIDAYIILTSSETDAASTEIWSQAIPTLNAVNQSQTFDLSFKRVYISSDTKLKVEASTTPASGKIVVDLFYEKF